MPIYPKQIKASKRVVDEYFCNPDVNQQINWATLIALTQSGKTETYLLTIFEMFRLEKIEKAYIICGSSDVALKSQLNKRLIGFGKLYRDYLRQNHSEIDGGTMDEISEKATEGTQIIWGSELKKISTELEARFSGKKSYSSQGQVSIYKALFVWDESHYAQSIGNQTEKFLTSIGISATGENLAKSETYFLSVSATPFSECSDIHHLNQNKGIVFLEGVNDPLLPPEKNYYGIKEMLETNKLIGYKRDKFKETLEMAINDRLINEEGEFRYGLIRVSGNKTHSEKQPAKKSKSKCSVKKPTKDESLLMKHITELAKKYGIVVKRCDSQAEEFNMRELKYAPEDSHVIVVVKERCRMGDSIDKPHVGFGMETSADANTDTMLQAFPGRLGGYDTNRSTKIYIPDNIIISGELERYISFIDNIQQSHQIVCLPTKAKNIVKENKTVKIRVGGQKPIIPLQFIEKDGILNEYFGNKLDKNGNPKLETTHKIQADLITAFKVMDIDKFIDNNNESDTKKIWEKLRDVKDIDGNGKFPIVVKTLCPGFTTYKRVPANLYNSFTNGVITPIGSETNCISVYIFGTNDYKDSYGFKKNDIFINVTVEADEKDVYSSRMRTNYVPKTSGKEVFSYRLPTKEKIDMNGAMLTVLTTDTMIDVDKMKTALKTLVSRSLDEPNDTGLVFRRSINALENQTLEDAGIYVIEEIYNALMVGGEIYNELLDEFKVELKLVRDPCQTSTVDAIDVVKLLEISW
jgi:hypothetical protein